MRSAAQHAALRPAACLAVALLAAAPAGASDGLALRAAKVLTAAAEGPQVIDHGIVLVDEGLIQEVGPADRVAVPAGYRVLDFGEHWLMPGMIDLHSHVGGTFDINDAVFQVNPGLRVTPAVRPQTSRLRAAVAGGVTTILFIPGSATNLGGQGVLLKTAGESYGEMRLRDPGSIKVAQGDNPTRWGYQMGRSLMNYHLRSTVSRGVAYARAWESWEAGDGERPERDIQLEVFRSILAGECQISTHTQIYQLVLTSITMFKIELGLDVFLDHSTFDGFKAAELAERHGVSAIVGPREVSIPLSRGCQNDYEGALQGVAAGYQERGHTMIGFNTDAPVVPQEELSLQSAMGVRYGLDNASLQAVRGVTLVPARTARIDERVGSLEPGKDADLLVVTGDPSDPRTSVEIVLIEGEVVYDASVDGRRF